MRTDSDECEREWAKPWLLQLGQCQQYTADYVSGSQKGRLVWVYIAVAWLAAGLVTAAVMLVVFSNEKDFKLRIATATHSESARAHRWIIGYGACTTPRTHCKRHTHNTYTHSHTYTRTHRVTHVHTLHTHRHTRTPPVIYTVTHTVTYTAAHTRTHCTPPLQS